MRKDVAVGVELEPPAPRLSPLATPPLDIGCAGTAASPPDVDRAATPAAKSLA